MLLLQKLVSHNQYLNYIVTKQIDMFCYIFGFHY